MHKHLEKGSSILSFMQKENLPKKMRKILQKIFRFDKTYLDT